MENIAKTLDAIMMDCLFLDKEIPEQGIPEGAVVVEGITGRFALHPERLESHRKKIVEIIREMPDNFQKHIGGGWSFLNLCMDKNGNQWGEHAGVQILCVLSIALKLGEFILPREFWPSLPGGMPYIAFDVTGEE